MTLTSATIVSAADLLGNPNFPIHAWENHSRRAYLSPLIVRDGFHDYVLLGRPEFEHLISVEGLSEDERAEVARTINEIKARKQAPSTKAAPPSNPR